MQKLGSFAIGESDPDPSSLTSFQAELYALDDLSETRWTTLDDASKAGWTAWLARREANSDRAFAFMTGIPAAVVGTGAIVTVNLDTPEFDTEPTQVLGGASVVFAAAAIVSFVKHRRSRKVASQAEAEAATAEAAANNAQSAYQDASDKHYGSPEE